ncbi:MMPL family transporter [Gordonia pseudamarae]|jgi:RND superfamily putative drug exporter|uniref:MMPL family transporter n=1 Tax=Gordonia pseudamarae TaxID=2831662 RepID=A0ABX6IH45_9ACTN|nr:MULTISPECIES: MMPL family transporter [Gordonia]MBD0020504.1 MMPL family transporter [Gordonia sp. (in: high G+C Gram-positive bacteria)]QHN25653.1 MMPL family transporter [Gordonia pseudamarae]QHN34585.1 MMPL family transporter [Gordonia pseudamarae]
MPERLTRAIIGAPRTVLIIALILFIGAGIYGAGAAKDLLPGGFSDPDSESSVAERILDERFDRGGLRAVIKLDVDLGTDISTDPAASQVGRQIIDELKTIDYVQDPVLSIWDQPQLEAGLLSIDRSSTQIIVSLSGGEDKAPARAEELSDRFSGERQGVRIRVGGQAMVFAEINTQSSRDLAIAEAIAIPITFLVLIIVFGGVVAASLPVGIGIIAIVLTFAYLRLIAIFTDVSVYALNLATAMGLALAIDYTLLLITRYREEVHAGRGREDAIVITMATAGRTVLFSAITVALALAALVIFPMYFLRSFAYAGIGVVVVALAAALILTPALLTVLGPRVDSLGVSRLLRRADRPQPAVEGTVWYRIGRFAMRRAVVVMVAVTAFLLLLGVPFLSFKFGFPDDRVLPASANSHQIQQEVRDTYAQNLSGVSTVVVTGANDPDSFALRSYSQDLARVEGVDSVTSSAGLFVQGAQVAEGDPTATSGGIAILTVSSSLEPTSQEGGDLVRALREVEPAEGMEAWVTGIAAGGIDAVDSIYEHLPAVLAVIAVATFILLFLFTGSVVLPFKALILNVLSLTATFGAMVFIFQEGHLGGFGTVATGHLVATMPVLMFCIAFGLSMDYEVFLLGRIREEFLASDGSREAGDHAVAVGLAKTGRVITAAALLMSIVFAAMAASGVSFMRMFGVGLAIAVLMDATLIRLLLVPAFMRLMGRLNWWAPAPLRRLHQRIGLSES